MALISVAGVRAGNAAEGVERGTHLAGREIQVKLPQEGTWKPFRERGCDVGGRHAPILHDFDSK